MHSNIDAQPDTRIANLEEIYTVTLASQEKLIIAVGFILVVVGVPFDVLCGKKNTPRPESRFFSAPFEG